MAGHCRSLDNVIKLKIAVILTLALITTYTLRDSRPRGKDIGDSSAPSGIREDRLRLQSFENNPDDIRTWSDEMDDTVRVSDSYLDHDSSFIDSPHTKSRPKNKRTHRPGLRFRDVRPSLETPLSQAIQDRAESQLLPADDFEHFDRTVPATSCPSEFRLAGEDENWFRKNFEQISPFTESNDKQVRQFEDDVLILTPISNVRNKLRHYFKLICSLTYPHSKISIYLGEDSSHDQTLDEALALQAILKPYFKRLEVFHLKGGQPSSFGNERHDKSYQLQRRRHLAMSRNQILMRALRDEPWVLWVDSDIKHVPVDLVQHLLSTNKSIVAANCLYRTSDGSTDVFDRNTWQETQASLDHLKFKSPDYLMLEGYGQSQRKYLNDLKQKLKKSTESLKISSQSADFFDAANSGVVNTASVNGTLSLKDQKFPLLKFHSTGKTEPAERTNPDRGSKKNQRIGDPVRLDGVGGCVLLVKADLHLAGLNFPPFVYHHHIETEGMAKMAAEVYGAEIYGLPWVHVVHW